MVHRVLVTCQLVWDLENEVRDFLAERSIEVDVPRYSGQTMAEEELIARIGRYDGILAGDETISRDVLVAGQRLRVISKWGIGVDAIDAVAAAELGVAVYNTPGVFGDELADYAMGFVHLLARRQHAVDARVKSGQWYKVRGTSLRGKTLGIVGLGSSGRALVVRALASGMRVIGCDIASIEDVEGCERTSMGELLATADVISLHLPLTPESRRLINAEALDSMKRGAWLVNVSRGGVVDESALVEALKTGHIAAAALDVFESEPIDPGSPLLSMENVVVGSHNGSNTNEAVERTTWLAVDNLVRGLGLNER